MHFPLLFSALSHSSPLSSYNTLLCFFSSLSPLSAGCAPHAVGAARAETVANSSNHPDQPNDSLNWMKRRRLKLNCVLMAVLTVLILLLLLLSEIWKKQMKPTCLLACFVNTALSAHLLRSLTFNVQHPSQSFTTYTLRLFPSPLPPPLRLLPNMCLFISLQTVHLLNQPTKSTNQPTNQILLLNQPIKSTNQPNNPPHVHKLCRLYRLLLVVAALLENMITPSIILAAFALPAFFLMCSFHSMLLCHYLPCSVFSVRLFYLSLRPSLLNIPFYSSKQRATVVRV